MPITETLSAVEQVNTLPGALILGGTILFLLCCSYLVLYLADLPAKSLHLVAWLAALLLDYQPGAGLLDTLMSTLVLGWILLIPVCFGYFLLSFVGPAFLLVFQQAKASILIKK